MEKAHQDCVCNAEQKYLMWCSSASNVGWQWKHKLLFFLSKLLNHNQNMNTKALCLSVCLAYSSTKLRADTDPKQRILRKTRENSGFSDDQGLGIQKKKNQFSGRREKKVQYIYLVWCRTWNWYSRRRMKIPQVCTALASVRMGSRERSNNGKPPPIILVTSSSSSSRRVVVAIRTTAFLTLSFHDAIKLQTVQFQH